MGVINQPRKEKYLGVRKGEKSHYELKAGENFTEKVSELNSTAVL